MKKLIINILMGIMAAALLTGCGKAGDGQAKEEAVGSVVVRKDTKEPESETDKLPEKRTGPKSGKAGGTKPEESILDEAELFEDKEEELTETERESITIVVGGISLEIPGEYGCFIEESKGPIVYRDDLFTMLINVREDSYEERMEEPDSLMDGAKKIGGEITKEIEEIEIGKNPYAWFTYSRNGDHFIVIFTPAADSGKRLCAQLIIENKDVSEEELLERFAKIAESACETDEPDTTDETLAEIMRLSDFGEKKAESVLAHGDARVTFQIEPNFYSQYTNTDDYWASEYFVEPSSLATVDCYLEPMEDGGDAKSYIENETAYMDEDKEIHKAEVKVDGHTFYYCIVKYEYDGSRFQKMIAASDAGNGHVYVVRAGYIDVADEIRREDFESFFRFKQE